MIKDYGKSKSPRPLKDRIPEWIYRNLVQMSFTRNVGYYLSRNKELKEIELKDLQTELIKQRAAKKLKAEIERKKGKEIIKCIKNNL